MMIEAAINGSRTRAEHPALPVTPAEQGVAAVACVAAGAGAIHVHVRGPDGRKSLASVALRQTLEASRSACPRLAVGVSTGAWIVPGPALRLDTSAAWDVLGVGVQAGLCDAGAAELLAGSGLAGRCLRALLEP